VPLGRERAKPVEEAMVMNNEGVNGRRKREWMGEREIVMGKGGGGRNTVKEARRTGEGRSVLEIYLEGTGVGK
jgi:hypothetical protein